MSLTLKPILPPTRLRPRPLLAPAPFVATTPILGLTLPVVGGDLNLWGAELNANFSAIDAKVLPLTGGALSGALTIAAAGPQLTSRAPAGQGVQHLFDRPAGQNATLRVTSGGIRRWDLLLASSEAEAGGNAGSDLYIGRFSDAGSFLDWPVHISRQSGVVDFSHTPTVNGVPLGSGGGGGGLADAPADGSAYGRLNAAWAKVLPLSGGTIAGNLGLTGNFYLPNNGAIWFADASAANQPILGVSPLNITFIRSASDAAWITLQNKSGADLLRVATAGISAFVAAAINLNAVAIPPLGFAGSTALLSLASTDANAGYLLTTSYGAANGLIMRRSQGTAAAPTLTTANQVLGLLGGAGYDGSAWSNGTRVSMRFVASQDWSGTSNPTHVLWQTCDVNQTVGTERMRLYSSGRLAVQPAGGTFTDDGVNAIQVAGSIAVNGNPATALQLTPKQYVDNKMVYVVGGFIPGVLTASQLLVMHKVSMPVSFPGNFGATASSAASGASAAALATAATVLTIAKCVAGADPSNAGNWTTIGTISFAAGGHAGTFASTGGAVQALAAGDKLRVTGPAGADATLGDLALSLAGDR